LSDLTVLEADRWEILEPLQDEWNRLLAESAGDTIFLRHEWLRLWWKHFGSGRRLAVFLARRGSRLVAALPLMEVRSSMAGIPVTTLQSLTNYHSFRFNALCAPGEEAALEAIWTALRTRKRRWDVVRMEEVPADAPVLDPLLRAARRDGSPVGAWRGAQVPYLRTEGSWEEYHATLSQGMRANLRRRNRQLREKGDVRYRCVSAPEAVPEALRIGLPLEGSGWKASQGSAIVSSATLTSFYSEWAAVAAENGWLRLSFLDVAGIPVAFDFSTLYGGRYYDLKMGYDPAWGRFSVGQIIKAEILRRCFESDTREYDFLGQTMRAKDDWEPMKRAHDWHFIYANTPLGHALHFGKFTAAPFAKRLLRR